MAGACSMAAQQDAPQARQIWQLAVQAAQKRKEAESTETPLSRETPESLLFQATNLQLCQGVSSHDGLVGQSQHLHWLQGESSGLLLHHKHSESSSSRAGSSLTCFIVLCNLCNVLTEVV